MSSVIIVLLWLYADACPDLSLFYCGYMLTPVQSDQCFIVVVCCYLSRLIIAFILVCYAVSVFFCFCTFIHFVFYMVLCFSAGSHTSAALFNRNKSKFTPVMKSIQENDSENYNTTVLINSEGQKKNHHMTPIIELCENSVEKLSLVGGEVFVILILLLVGMVL